MAVSIGVSKLLLMLIPAALLTLFFSMYHVTVLTNQDCEISKENAAGFAIPAQREQTKTNAVAIAHTFKSSSTQNYKGPYKIYKKWKYPFPCVPAEPRWKTIKVQRSPAAQGLLYVREMKTGSSTLAGVVLSIAHRKARQLLKNNPNDMPCKVRVDHSPARRLEYDKRNKHESFLISLLRDPTKRATSQFFHFHASDKGVAPTDANFQSYLIKNAPKFSNYYINDLAMGKVENQLQHAANNDNYDELVQSILDEYNFIAITERMDESLIVLKILLDLDYGDVLYMSAKNAGSFTSAGGGPNQPPHCIYIIPSFVTPGMQKFFSSQYWKRYIAADLALYKAANASLDKTIDALGRQTVQQQLQVFERLKQQAQTRCMDRTIYRCDATGNYVGAKNATCLLWDVGCGHECLTEFAKEI